jgi:hypothetical protein
VVVLPIESRACQSRGKCRAGEVCIVRDRDRPTARLLSSTEHVVEEMEVGVKWN